MGIFDKFKELGFQREQIKAFKDQPADKRQIVFYAESKADWSYIGPIIEELTTKHGLFVSYLTSEKEDPQLSVKSNNTSRFYVGQGAPLILLFQTLDCKIMVTSLSDLGTYHLKRSVNEVHYMYVYHSMSSVHANYREAAFDNYDTIFTVGPHQDNEIRKREKMLGLPTKTLVKHGYARLDNLIKEAKGYKLPKHSRPEVLIGSSWGPSSITDRCAIPLVRVLLDAGMKVSYRPHPMSQWHAQSKLEAIQKEFKNNKDFSYEIDMRTSSSLLTSDALITDWSGIALEYSFTYGKPVYSIDTPRKVNNENYKDLDLPALEDWIRKDIGAIIPEDNLGLVVKEINKNFKNPQIFANRSFQLRDKWIYNIGKSAKVAAEHIAKQAKSL